MSNGIHPKWCAPIRPRPHGNIKADLRAADAIASPPAPDGDPLAELGVIQQRVARLIGYGMTNAQIGAVMGVSDQTIKNHTTKIFRTLKIDGMGGVSSRRLAYLIGRWDAIEECRRRGTSP